MHQTIKVISQNWTVSHQTWKNFNQIKKNEKVTQNVKQKVTQNVKRKSYTKRKMFYTKSKNLKIIHQIKNILHQTDGTFGLV